MMPGDLVSSATPAMLVGLYSSPSAWHDEPAATHVHADDTGLVVATSKHEGSRYVLVLCRGALGWANEAFLRRRGLHG